MSCSKPRGGSSRVRGSRAVAAPRRGDWPRVVRSSRNPDLDVGSIDPASGLRARRLDRLRLELESPLDDHLIARLEPLEDRGRAVVDGAGDDGPTLEPIGAGLDED